MSYDELIYQLGKLYRQWLEKSSRGEFPRFSGHVSDLLDEASMRTLPTLEGEYIIAYSNGKGTNHFVRVYFDEGTFEAEGTPGTPLFSMSLGGNV